ncbi:MAG TPA: condensation domain-containing protein, partial [Casimicrobiaceae bacterium]|nr:condensation domain-containing protein [Casimicrobiaceae bacterium]
MEDIASPIVRRARKWRSEAPLSAQQEQIWLAAQRAPDAPTYSVAEVLPLHGTLDVSALHGALNGVVARHEALRTRFVTEAAGELRQIIVPESMVSLPLDDLCADSDAVAEARRCANDFAATGFDLAAGPPFRARLLKLGASEHWLVVVMHHIVTDGWSRVVFWRDLAALYEVMLRGEQAQLPHAPLQYADYACWQRDMREREEFALRRDYWRRTLAGVERLALPVDRLPPQLAKHDGAERSRVLDPSVVAALVNVGKRSDATLFVTLFAALLVWLSRHTGADDLAVGFPSAGRDRPELADVVGCFVRTLVLRANLAGSPSFSEVLGRVRTGVLEALAHQDVPLDLAAREAPMVQHQGLGTPWFDVFFNMRGKRTSPTRHVRLGEADGDVAHLDTGSAKFALSVTVSERADGRLEVLFAYASALFDAATIDRMQIRWLTLLEAIAADEKRPIAQLPMLGDDERALLARWSGPAVSDAVDVPITELFAAQVRRAPNAVAVVWDRGSLTYGVLARHASTLAQTLRRLGVRSDVPVGVYVERSPELVVALLAILEAGGAYLPLDPDYPKARIERVLDDARPPVVLTQFALRDRLPKRGAEIVCVDLAAKASEATAHTESPMPARPRDLAYVIYTSGSTGQPKGVMIEQRSVATHIADMRDAFAMSADDCVLHTAAIGFDQAIGQILMAVLTGARVALPTARAHHSADEIAEAIVRYGVTILRTVPTLLAAIASGPGFAACRSLRLVLSAGEPLAGSIVDAIHAQCPAEVVNAYGPSETTFMATVHRCSRGERTPSEV